MIAVGLAGSGELSQVRVINPATTPIYPSFPQIFVNTVIGLGAGIFVAFLALVVADTVSGTVKTTADLRRLTGDRALGRLPRALATRMSDPGWRASRRQRKKLETLGTFLEPGLAMLDDVDAPAIQVTGFGPPSLIAGAAVGIAAALAVRGNRVSYSLLEARAQRPPPSEPDERLRELFENDPEAVSNGVIHVECLGPVSAWFRWREVARRSPALVCVVPGGDLPEETVQRFQADASRNDVSAMFFLMISG